MKGSVFGLAHAHVFEVGVFVGYLRGQLVGDHDCRQRGTIGTHSSASSSQM